MRMVILYELPNRELENDLLLKRYLHQKGHDCEIVKYPFQKPYELRRQYYDKIDVIIVHSLPDEIALNKLVYFVFGKVAYIFNTQVEQIGTNKSENDQSYYRWPTDSTKYAYHVCWGQKCFDSMSKFGVNGKKLLLTGPIQMDFLRPEFRGYYQTKDELLARYGINSKLKICLFISSFSYVGLPEYARKDLKRIIGEERFTSFERVSIDSQTKMLKWFDKLLSSNPGFLLIYRKHPAERVSEQLRKLADKYPQSLRLVSDYSVKQWIIGADSILTWYSTSVGEAYFANKKVLVLRPVKIEPEDDVTILNGTNFVSEYDEFIKALEEGEYSGLDRENMMSYFDVDSNCPSFIRLGDKIIDISSKSDNIFPWEKVPIEEFDRMNKKRKRKSYILHIYILCIALASKIWRATGLTLGGNIQKRIDNHNNSIIKQREQEKDIKTIMEKEAFINVVVDKFLEKVGLHE